MSDLSTALHHARDTNDFTSLLSLIPYEEVPVEPVVLEERPPQPDYIRPPMEEQEFVPQVHRNLL